jgi:DNA-binding HxlR family transcriptional regulator
MTKISERSQPELMTEEDRIIVKKAQEVVCGKWRLFILLHLSHNVRRYSELRRLLPDVSEKVLIQELKTLVQLGVLEKQSYKEVPPRVEYRLSERGRSILPILLQIKDIGRHFLVNKSEIKVMS